MNKKHGLVNSPEYKTWAMMLVRCRNKNNHAYPRYGGRGIKVCKRWESFENFYADVGAKPSPKHSLDRIDNNGNYEPSNCRWATMLEQGRNKRNNAMLTLNGVTKCISEWADITGIKRRTIHARISYGWPVEKVLTASLMTKAEAGRIGGTSRHV